MRCLLLTIGLALLATTALAAEEPKLACPGATLTLKKMEKAPIPNQPYAYRVCVSLRGAMDGLPASGELWTIRDGSPSEAVKKTGTFCDASSANSVFEFRFGAVTKPTTVYWSWQYQDDMNEDKQLSKLVMPAFKSIFEEGVLLNPCIPACKQLKRPVRTDYMKQTQCHYVCKTGPWEIDCPTQSRIDPTTKQTKQPD